jgi:hypothetical protein
MIKNIIITGGPCAGKTTVVSHLERIFGGDMIAVPDVAQHVQQVFPRPEMQADIGAKLAVMRHLRTAVARIQEELETAYVTVGRKLGVKAIVYDGGILDGAAYWPEGLGNFLSEMQLRKDEICAGYRAIIHLQTLAVSQPELYRQLRREQRHAPTSEAQLADQIIRQAWSSHNNYHLVTTESPELEVQKKVVRLIHSLIPDLAPLQDEP